MSARPQTSGEPPRLVRLAAGDFVAGLSGAPGFFGVAVGSRAISPIGSQAHEGFDDRRVEVRAGAGLQVSQRLLRNPSGSIRTVGRQRVPDIGNGNDTSDERNRRAREASGITGPVDA